MHRIYREINLDLTDIIIENTPQNVKVMRELNIVIQQGKQPPFFGLYTEYGEGIDKDIITQWTYDISEDNLKNGFRLLYDGTKRKVFPDKLITIKALLEIVKGNLVVYSIETFQRRNGLNKYKIEIDYDWLNDTNLKMKFFNELQEDNEDQLLTKLIKNYQKSF